jgi:hypothetical protein
MDAMEEMAAFKAGKDQRCYEKGTALTENSWTFRSDYMFYVYKNGPWADA